MMGIVDPVNAYLFLSDDVQDEISGTGKKRMKCLSCGQRFTGEISDNCPERFSPDTDYRRSDRRKRPRILVRSVEVGLLTVPDDISRFQQLALS